MKKNKFIFHSLRKILGCCSRMCNEAVWGDMGLETRRDRAILKLWCKVCRVPDNRYPKTAQEWKIKPRKGTDENLQ